MFRRSQVIAITLVALLSLTALLIVGCGSETPKPAENPPAEQPTDPSSTPGGDPSAGMRLANGLYEIEGGKVQAIGILEYKDLEGGFWAVTNGDQGGAETTNLAVIANGAEFEAELKGLEGKLVNIIGKKFDGASIRQAGPEIEMESVQEMSDTPGIAE